MVYPRFRSFKTYFDSEQIVPDVVMFTEWRRDLDGDVVLLKRTPHHVDSLPIETLQKVTWHGGAQAN